MDNDDDIKQLLTEIRDNQKLALEHQAEQLEIARKQLDRANTQVQESIELQKLAMRRFKSISIIAFPAIITCIVLILYLVVRYF